MKVRLEEEVKLLHHPDSEETTQFFRDYAGVDLEARWRWNNHDSTIVRTKLNGLISLRGDVAHRSRKVPTGAPEPHPVTKARLEKAISFLKSLVEATEKHSRQPSSKLVRDFCVEQTCIVMHCDANRATDVPVTG
jgi:hypothetical protein